MADLLEHLNEHQKRAVLLPDVSALILAGAGSGKTRVLTSRIIWLLKSGKAFKSEILAVTFTNKAAKEMLARIEDNSPAPVRGMWIGTFHGMCNRFLRKHYKEAGLAQNFQILDQSDQLSLIKRVLKLHGASDELYPPREILHFIETSKEAGLRAKDVSLGPAKAGLVQIYAWYEDQCAREGVLDFAELLLRSYELLANDAILREHYQRRFRYILVDEFQDTNVLQYRWLRLLGGFNASGVRERRVNCVFAVGDDDQSIYSFRGANVGNMTDFLRDFEVCKENVIRLEQNYRSYGHILDAANALISNNNERLGKNLWTSSGDGDRITVYEADNDRLEAQFVTDEIRSRIRNGTSPDEIAILYRSNAQSRVLEQALMAAGIAYRVYGGQRFFDRAEIKHALAYLRLIENPNDDTSFLRVVNFPARGIGAKTLESLQAKAQEEKKSLYACVQMMKGTARAKLAQFTELIDEMAFEFSQLPLPQLIAGVVEKSGLKAFYQADKDGEERLENLVELENAANVYLAEEGGRSGTGEDEDDDEPELEGLSGFLSYAALESGSGQAEAGVPAVQLMTVHAAKGLEFNTVFITGVEDGLFPHNNSIESEHGLQEERRLMYVAVTRAKEKLYITCSSSRMLHGRFLDSGRSRFLDEIPEEHLSYINRRASSFSSSQNERWNSFSHGMGEAVRSRTAFGNNARLGTSEAFGYRIGEKVVHRKFGPGEVVGFLGQGEDARIRVRFDAGVKELLLSLAKLEKAD